MTAHEVRDAAAGEVGTILFAAGSASVDTQGRAALAAVAARLRNTHAGKATVTGFSNQLIDPAGNTALAQARAAAVAAALRADLAGTDTTVRTQAVGQSDPAAAETTAAGRLADARATVTVPGAALIGGDGVAVHPAAGSAALPADAIGVTLFPGSSAVFDAADRAVVAAAAQRISAAHSRSVVVTGYTDSTGGAAGATTLSRSRAQAVADALRADLGADAPTITVRALGEQDQIATDATADGRRLNRRAVISIS